MCLVENSRGKFTPVLPGKEDTEEQRIAWKTAIESKIDALPSEKTMAKNVLRFMSKSVGNIQISTNMDS
tara:strand:+ start:889 stop:1095 length:207 start_codon:yes stop_codon:yes gene_type:complete